MVFSTPFTKAFNITVPVCLAPMAGVSGGKLAGEYSSIPNLIAEESVPNNNIKIVPTVSEAINRFM